MRGTTEPAREAEQLARERATQLVLGMVDAARRRDVARLMTFYADDAVAVSPVFGEVHGAAAIAATWERLFATFTDPEIRIEDLLVDGDRIAVLSTVSTVDRLGWFGLEPTGAPIAYRLVLLLTTHGGRVVRDERMYDSVGVIERLEKARLDREMRTAAEVQRALLARTAHRLSFCECAASSLPCRAIGGDFFDFIDLPNGSVGIVVGDVSGKGPAAALLASLILGILAAQSRIGSGPAATLEHLNAILLDRRIEPRFATLFYAVVSPEGRLVYSNAGHNAPMLFTSVGVRRLTVGGPIVGAFPAASFEEEALSPRAGDTLVAFTDGVSEAVNAEEEEFGEERVLSCARHLARSVRAAVLIERVLSDVRAFSNGVDLRDDVTVVAARFRSSC